MSEQEVKKIKVEDDDDAIDKKAKVCYEVAERVVKFIESSELRVSFDVIPVLALLIEANSTATDLTPEQVGTWLTSFIEKMAEGKKVSAFVKKMFGENSKCERIGEGIYGITRSDADNSESKQLKVEEKEKKE